jgi:uncharacterized protein involved in tolerance to divalent cations
MFACVFPNNIFNEWDDIIKLDKNVMLLIKTATFSISTVMRLHSWLRHYATSRKVAGLSLDEVDFFN